MAEFIGEYPIAPLSRSVARALLDWRQWHECRESSMAPRERSVLDLLLRSAGRVVPKERIETALSEFGDEISTNAVELAISRLRRRLANFDPGIAFETIRGVGYMLRENTRDA